jgi:hypothetical protein
MIRELIQQTTEIAAFYRPASGAFGPRTREIPVNIPVTREIPGDGFAADCVLRQQRENAAAGPERLMSADHDGI